MHAAISCAIMLVLPVKQAPQQSILQLQQKVEVPLDSCSGDNKRLGFSVVG